MTSTFDLSYFYVNMDQFWRKTEITSENQNDAEKKRKLPLLEFTGHVKKVNSTEKE